MWINCCNYSKMTTVKKMKYHMWDFTDFKTLFNMLKTVQLKTYTQDFVLSNYYTYKEEVYNIPQIKWHPKIFTIIFTFFGGVCTTTSCRGKRVRCAACNVRCTLLRTARELQSFFLWWTPLQLTEKIFVNIVPHIKWQKIPKTTFTDMNTDW